MSRGRKGSYSTRHPRLPQGVFGVCSNTKARLGPLVRSEFLQALEQRNQQGPDTCCVRAIVESPCGGPAKGEEVAEWARGACGSSAECSAYGSIAYVMALAHTWSSERATAPPRRCRCRRR